jgi:hypothetical protein
VGRCCDRRPSHDRHPSRHLRRAGSGRPESRGRPHVHPCERPVCRLHDLEDGMTISAFRRLLYLIGRFLADFQAVRRGRVAERVHNRLAGKLLGKATRNLWR